MWKNFGSGMEKIRIRDTHPGSATLHFCQQYRVRRQLLKNPKFIKYPPRNNITGTGTWLLSFRDILKWKSRYHNPCQYCRRHSVKIGWTSRTKYRFPCPTSRILDSDPQTDGIIKRFWKMLGVSDYEQNKRSSAEKNLHFRYETIWNQHLNEYLDMYA